jgi:ABC-type transport system substrate-binding protein
MSERTRARLRPSGTGPFVPREIRFGKTARFDRFEGYWDRSHVALDGVDLDLAEDSEAGVFQRFLDGQLDVTWDVPYNEAARMMADARLRPYIDSIVQLHTSFVVLRCDKPPLADSRVRRALNHAIDRNRINDRYYSGLAVPAASLLPPHLLGHDPNLRPLRHDPERARSLLAQAGVPAGTELTVWETPVDGTDPQNPLASIRADLEAVGISLKVEVLTGEEMKSRSQRGEYPHMRRRRWFADFPDPDTFFNLLSTKNEDFLQFALANQMIDGLIERGARATDGREREEIYRDLNRLVQTEAPAIFLFHDRGFVAHRPNLRGLRTYLLPPPVRWPDLSFEK